MRFRLLDTFLRKLVRAVTRAREDARPAFEEMVDPLRREITGRFDQQGPNWTPLKRSTIRRRRRAGLRAGPILVAFGDLRGSFEGASGEVARITRGALELGSSIDHAAPHQYGADFLQPIRRRTRKYRAGSSGRAPRVIGYRHIIFPARPFVTGPGGVVTEAQEGIIGGAMARYLERLVRQEVSR